MLVLALLLALTPPLTPPWLLLAAPTLTMVGGATSATMCADGLGGNGGGNASEDGVTARLGRGDVPLAPPNPNPGDVDTPNIKWCAGC